jgi:hypothetical protein
MLYARSSIILTGFFRFWEGLYNSLAAKPIKIRIKF